MSAYGNSGDSTATAVLNGTSAPRRADDARVADASDLRNRNRIAKLELEVAQLREAVASGRRIGMVTGMLAERFALTPEETWAFLVRLSQQSNIKVRDLARVLYDSQFGELSHEDTALAIRLTAGMPNHTNLFPGLDTPPASR